MTFDDFLTLLTNGSGWLALLYIFITQILPKFVPVFAKSLDKNQTREDRLFTIIADTNVQNAKLAVALEALSAAFRENTYRIDKLDNK